MIVRTNKGELEAELVRHNKKTVLVKITNRTEVETKNATGETIKIPEITHKVIKRSLTDVVKY